jgi:hypothetical protein
MVIRTKKLSLRWAWLTPFQRTVMMGGFIYGWISKP